MDKQLKSEIRAILSARTATDSDGWIVACEGRIPMTVYGVGDSSAVYGITSKSVAISVADNAKMALQKLSKAFQNFGEMVALKHDEEAIAVLRRKCFGKSVMLTAKNEGEGNVLLTAYAGRGIFAKCTCNRVLKSIKKSLAK